MYLKNLKNGSPAKRNKSSPMKQSVAMKSIERSLGKTHNRYLDDAFSSDSDDEVFQPLSI